MVIFSDMAFDTNREHGRHVEELVVLVLELDGEFLHEVVVLLDIRSTAFFHLDEKGKELKNLGLAL